MEDSFWAKLHKLYSDKEWISKPSLFAETVKEYIPTSGKLLDLGAGLGQDSAYFTELGYEVTSTDLDIGHLCKLAGDKFHIEEVDLRQPLPYSNESFDVVYAHLSLHYFDKQTTERIFEEIYRVLKLGGVFAFFTNSTDDPEFNTGKKLEENYLEIEGVAKRYLDVEAATNFAKKFKPRLVDNDGETYKDSAKGIHNLIRFIGTR